MTTIKIPAGYMRGGTSKGLLVRREDLPADPEVRDSLLSFLLGSPDPYLRQIDGLGGATSSTSKVAIISPSAREDCDVDYLVGQVDIGQPLVDYSSNCGNLSSAVGPYAVRAGLVKPHAGITEVRIWQENTARRIIARVPTTGGQPEEEGDYEIDGVRGTGALIELEFLDPAGTAFDCLLPTGNVIDTIDVPGHPALEISVIDCGMVMSFVRAADIGLIGTELKLTLDANAAVLAHLEAIRGAVAVKLGLCSEPELAATVSPALPKIAIISAPQDHKVAGGRLIAASDIDLVARGISMGVTHHAYEVTGAIATASAACIPGTLVNLVSGLEPALTRTVRIGHASGKIEVGIRLQHEIGGQVVSATLGRTARLLMEGTTFLPASLTQISNKEN